MNRLFKQRVILSTNINVPLDKCGIIDTAYKLFSPRSDSDIVASSKNAAGVNAVLSDLLIEISFAIKIVFMVFWVWWRFIERFDL